MSMKNSLLTLALIIVAVTVFTFLSGGDNAMLVDMSDTSISFSGIENFSRTIPYSDISKAELVDAGNTELLGYKDELYKAGFGTAFQEGAALGISTEVTYEYFITTQTDKLIVLTLSDGTLMLFNYNNTSSTESIYEILLKNIH